MKKRYILMIALCSMLSLFVSCNGSVGEMLFSVYKVRFDSNGGTAVQAQTVKEGEKATKPTDPTKDGFIFINWTTDEDGTEEYDFESAVNADITLYAQWRVSYNVGDTIELGLKDGKAITWIVLAVDTDDNTALLISKDILDSSQFGGSSSTYKDSSIRSQLTNGGFFTKYSLDKSYMVNKEDLSDVDVTDKDYVFLLSNTEYNSYKNTIATAGNIAGWWLRTPQSDDKVFVVQAGGSAIAEYVKISPYTGGIRPAFWYKLN